MDMVNGDMPVTTTVSTTDPTIQMPITKRPPGTTTTDTLTLTLSMRTTEFQISTHMLDHTTSRETTDTIITRETLTETITVVSHTTGKTTDSSQIDIITPTMPINISSFTPTSG